MQNTTINDLSNEKHLFIELLSSYVKGENSEFDFTAVNLSYIGFLSTEQGLGSIMYKAIENLKEFDDEVKERLFDYYQKSIFMCAARNKTLSRISSAFEKNEIDFMIIKGAVIQGFYPSPELRVMSDIDFLVKKEFRKKAKEILESLNIKFVEPNSYQDIYEDCNGIFIEIHHALWGYNLENTALYLNLWNEKNLVNGRKHTYILSIDDLYIFTIAHMYKHFCTSGIGIRPIFDIWFILKNNISNMNFSYIKSELKKINANEFEKNILSLVNSIFLNKEKTDDLKLIEDYLLRCRTHGTDKIASANAMGNKSKSSRIISMLFPSFTYMKRKYSFLKYLPFLLPFLWLFRIISLPFKSKRLSANVGKIKNVSSEDTEYLKKVFNAAGIKFDSSGGNKKIILLYLLFIFIFLTIIFSIIFFTNEKGLPMDKSSETSEIEASNEDLTENSEDIQNDFSAEGSIYTSITWRGGTYTGYILNNKPHGSGKHTINGVLSYVGIFVDGQYEGQGKIVYSDGSYYEGNFSKNQSNGEGTLYCANGDIISGIFTNGQPGGYCTYQYSDGTLFVGTMILGVKHGEGTFYWVNGDKYEGSFVNDKRDGYGILTYANGDIYSGTWSNGFCSGYGVYTWNDGRKYEGDFENGIMNDTDCVISYPNGSMYEGEIKEGVVEGSGKLTYSNGDIAEGTFVSGYLSGEAKFYFKKQNKWCKAIYDKGQIIKYIYN